MIIKVKNTFINSEYLKVAHIDEQTDRLTFIMKDSPPVHIDGVGSAFSWVMEEIGNSMGFVLDVDVIYSHKEEYLARKRELLLAKEAAESAEAKLDTIKPDDLAGPKLIPDLQKIPKLGKNKKK